MSERERHGESGIAARFREALYSDVEQGPARLELERRRLLARLPRGPVARRTGRGVRVVAVGLGAALAAAAAVTLALWPGEPVAVVESISLAGPWRVHPGDAVTRGVPVRVPEGAGARLELPDGTVLWLGPGVEIVALDGEVRTLRLDAGRLLASVAPRRPGEPFRVVAGRLEVTVRGTIFSVAAEGGRSRVRLHEGRVGLVAGERTIDVRPGFEVELGGDGTVVLRPVGEAGALGDLLMAQRAMDPDGPPLPAIPLPIAPTTAVEAPPVVAPEPPAREPARRPSSPRPSPPAPEVRPPPAPLPEPAIADPELAGISVEPAAAPDDLYLRALEQARAGDLEGSRRSLKDYLARFPEGRYWDRVRDILGD